MTAHPGPPEATPYDPATKWAAARLIYPLYYALARECVIDVLPCQDLERESDRPEEGSLDTVRDWFLKMDERTQVHQLRHFLQTTSLANSEALQALVLHHLRKQPRDESDRDKVDFLLVQIFSLSVPSRLRDSELDFSYVAGIIGPVVGHFELVVPEWLERVNELTRQSEACRTLKELFTSRIIEQGRKLKETCGESYFLPVAMTAFTRFGFLLRRTFFRLMHQDLNAILDGLRELESRGVEGLDCRKAQFSAYEPMLRLRMICQSWKVMFHAEYSSGQPLCLLVDLRTVVDAALAKTASKSKNGQRPVSGVNSLAAAAGADIGLDRTISREFEPSSEHAAAHNEDVDSN